ncbi:hypothetical protein NFI95_05085 [Acetobacteraceae bacterium KSS8]|uniref:Uncharacterized protein n=1 Tax=Endosaccharibacter trunci TaxID=2812733 RepID=A0ABT1W7K8_9PROT|nr:hypothetical protein [Acetobacteraceae bacterium KSS8]
MSVAFPLRVARVAGIGLVTGSGFVFPIAAMTLTEPGTNRTVALMIGLVAAVVVIRGLGRVLHRLLDREPRERRFPLLALYGVAAMLPPAALLVLPTGTI